MAEGAAVSALFSVVADKLVPLLEREVCLLWGVHDEALKLQTTLSLIQDVLADAEERSIRERAVRDWLTKLADVAYDADDVLDEFQSEKLLRMSALRRGFFLKVSSFFSLSNPLVFRLRMGHKISKIREKLQAIAEDRTRYQLREGVVPEWRIDVAERETHSFVAEDEVFGRDHEKEKIISLLINTNEDANATVIPVVGMPGMGKTTLAQLVYNDPRVRHHFSKQMWAFVSDVFDLKRVIKSIISTATGVECQLSNMELLQRRLGEVLSGSKYLLVLDDVWTGGQESWDRLMQLLRRGGSPGSKIIVTARTNDVAEMTRTVMPLYLDGLSDDDCWKVFQRRAFGTVEGEVNQRLEAIGKQIVRKCGGVPLAAKSLGGLLQSQEEEGKWLNVRDSEIWQLPEDGRGILAALKLSYDHLPSPVKQCFAYCSLFHKGYEFVEDDLIEMWIAEGFILSSGYPKQLEDIARDYVNVLLSCSFFGAEKSFGKSRLKMHDLVHDLACSVASDRFLHLGSVGEMKLVPQKCRHLSIHEQRMASTNFQAANQLRSFHLGVDVENCQGKSTEKTPSNVLATLSRLRVLEISHALIVQVPKSIGELKHLRYLNLSHTRIERLPECIGNLQNLRTLDLSHCTKLERLPQALSSLQTLVTLDLGYCYQLCELPNGMSNLTNLKHLKMECCSSSKTPTGIGRLGNLQTLTFFAVGMEHGCSIAELQFLNQLRGELEIRGIENVENEADAVKANLKEKHELGSLKLTWYSNVPHKNAKGVLDALRPPPDIRELQIFGYTGLALPSWMKTPTVQSSLANLVALSLLHFEKCESLPSLGTLASLKKLSLQFPMVKCIDAEFYGDGGTFPSLEELSFHGMLNLEEWSMAGKGEEIHPFPHLIKLVIENCPNLQALPSVGSDDMLLCHFDSLEELVIDSCDKLVSLGGRGDGLDLQRSPSLLKLRINSCPSLRSLPEWEVLSSLTSLYIYDCINLESLPEGFERLTRLQTLIIHGCPKLTKRCSLGGEDRRKIAHVPFYLFHY